MKTIAAIFIMFNSLLPFSWAANPVAPTATGGESAGLSLKGGTVRNVVTPTLPKLSGVRPSSTGTTPYPETFRYLNEAPSGPMPLPIELDGRPKQLEFLPPEFFGSKTSLVSTVLRLAAILMMLGILGYGGWALWHKR